MGGGRVGGRGKRPTSLQSCGIQRRGRGISFIGPGSGATAPRDKRQREGQPCRLGALNHARLSTAATGWARRLNQAPSGGEAHEPVKPVKPARPARPESRGRLGLAQQQPLKGESVGNRMDRRRQPGSLSDCSRLAALCSLQARDSHRRASEPRSPHLCCNSLRMLSREQGGRIQEGPAYLSLEVCPIHLTNSKLQFILRAIWGQEDLPKQVIP